MAAPVASVLKTSMVILRRDCLWVGSRSVLVMSCQTFTAPTAFNVEARFSAVFRWRCVSLVLYMYSLSPTHPSPIDEKKAKGGGKGKEKEKS